MNDESIDGRAHRSRSRVTGAALVAIVLGLGLGACKSDDEGTTVSEDDATIAALTTQLADETKRADDAEAELAEVAAQFPLTVTAAVTDFDLIGAYTMSLTEAYCDGAAACGTVRPAIRADIIQGANGLEIKVPNVFTAGLFDVNGSLFAVTDSDLILEPCAATPRNARVSITIFADGVTIEADGTRSLSGLGASLLVSADEVESCPASVVFFAATLTPA